MVKKLSVNGNLYYILEQIYIDQTSFVVEACGYTCLLSSYWGYNKGEADMIDEQRTLEIFGYVSGDWTDGSHKKVVFICEQCGRYRIGAKRDHRELCKGCTTGNRNTANANGKIKKQCKECGKTFEVWSSVANQKYCSRKCSDKNVQSWKSGGDRKIPEALRIRNQKGGNNPNWVGRVEVVCEVCGKIFRRKPSQEKHIFCSYKCRGIGWRGENNPMWNNGSSFMPYCAKFNERFKETIRDIFDRECFICGKSENDNGRKLSVHHVSYSKDCLCDGIMCEFVPLCNSCHSKTNGCRDLWERLITNVIEYISCDGKCNQELLNGMMVTVER